MPESHVQIASTANDTKLEVIGQKGCELTQIQCPALIIKCIIIYVNQITYLDSDCRCGQVIHSKKITALTSHIFINTASPVCPPCSPRSLTPPESSLLLKREYL